MQGGGEKKLGNPKSYLKENRKMENQLHLCVASITRKKN